MTSLTDIDGNVFAYEFDCEGNRLSQSLNDCLSKRFVYGGADVLLELNPTNGVAYAWVNGPGIDQPIERLLFIDGSPRARLVFHSDALGSIAALTDPDGLVTQTYAYSAFGSLRSSTGPDPNRVTYTGREQLGDSQGWMYYRHRIYTPWVGRFCSTDPYAFYDGINWFIYVKNKPISSTDSSGLGDINLFPEDDQNDMHHKYDLVPVEEGILTVGGHGSPDGVSIHRNPVYYVMLGMQIMNHPRFKEVKEVRLDSCETGKGSYAQYVADFIGIPVSAPTEIIEISDRGEIRVVNGGVYEKFVPENQ